MNLFISVLFFVIGFIIVISGAHFLVKGAVSLARRLSISELVIGLTVVAFGTSTPELIVNVFSSVGNHNEIVFGNIIGSNILNILLILGIAGLIHPLVVQKNTVWKEIPFSLLAVAVLAILVNDISIHNASENNLSFVDGIILLGFFSLFLIYTFKVSKITYEDDTVETTSYNYPRTILFILIGFLGLFIGGKMVVDGAVGTAQALSVSEKLIAFTIVATGTSLPELATSAVAAYRRKSDIAVGNIVGSNIFNIFLILGISGFLHTTYYPSVLNIDLGILGFTTLFLFITMFTGGVRKLDRWEAALFLLIYIGYTVFLIFRR